MKKAVILTGGKQYLVEEGQKLDVELLGEDELFDGVVSGMADAERYGL